MKSCPIAKMEQLKVAYYGGIVVMQELIVL